MSDLGFALTRAVHYAACMMILNVCAFDRLVAEGPRWPLMARRWMLIALGGAIISGVAWFGLVAMDMSDLPAREALQPDVLGLVWNQTQFGVLWKWRLVLTVAAAAAALPLWAKRGRRPPWVLLLLGVALVGSLAWSGHGQTGPRAGWHLAVDATHLLAISLWPAGLAPFAWLLWRIRRDGDGESVRRITGRFSAMSLTAVPIIAATGVANSAFLVGSLSNLVHTPYGQVLLVKIAAFTVMVGVGAINLLRYRPRLAGEPAGAAGAINGNVLVEIALAAAVLMLVGFLGRMAPPGCG